MAALNLPEELKPGVVRMLEVSDEAISELASQLEKAPFAFSSEDLSEAITPQIKGISPSDLDEMLESLVFLYAVRDSAEVPLADFVDDVTEGLEQEEDLAQTLGKVTPDKFKERLSVLLNIKAVAITSKARSKQKAHEKTLCTAQLLTDIRPVFGSNGDDAPVAAVPIYTLNISYHHGRILKEFFVALDADDLDILEDLIHQARSESAQLKSILNTVKIPYPEEE